MENLPEESQKEEFLKNNKSNAEINENSEKIRKIKNMNKIEAALFIAGRWLNIQELIMLTDLNPLLIKELIKDLKKKYETENSAIEILEKENMWKMDVKEEHVHMVNKLATGSSEFTKAEQETLAIIAYKHPVKQSVIIKIRGNKAYDHIKKFIQLGLVKAKKSGHTLELTLSENFYNYFHIEKR